MTRHEAAEKIRKVMSRATSPFAGEARTAAFMAKDLMERHGIDLSDLEGIFMGDESFARYADACRFYWGGWDDMTGEGNGDGHDTDQRTWSDDEPINPINYFTKNPYKGGNVDILTDKARREGFRSKYWLGFGQARRMGLKVKRGNKGTKIWRYHEERRRRADGEEEVLRRVFPAYVWNLDQTEPFQKKGKRR